jgi:hypothetical protein
MRSPQVWFVSLFAILLISPPALATHEVDHRYVVFGYVGDDQGRPLAGKKVTAIDTTIQLRESVQTDSNGYYEILLHLHDNNQGDSLEVRVEDQKKEIRISFDPSDKTTARRQQVDFGAPVRAKNNTWIYWVSGAVTAGIIGLAWYRAKRKRHQKAAGKKTKPKPKPKK